MHLVAIWKHIATTSCERLLSVRTFDRLPSLSDHRDVPKKPNARGKRIMVRITSELHEKIARLAAAEHRSIANWAAFALEEAVARTERKSKPKP